MILSPEKDVKLLLLSPWADNQSGHRDARPWVRFCLTAHLRQTATLGRRARVMQRVWEGVEFDVERQGLPDRVVEEVFFWGVHGQAELDLLIFRDGKRLGYEVKYTDRPRARRSQHLASQHLRLDQLTVVIPGDANYPLADGVAVRGLNNLLANPM
jgi:hypothetical protein